MDEIVIVENKKKAMKNAALGILMLLVSAYVLLIGLVEINIFDIAIGLFGTVFFGACLLFIIKMIINPKPLLIIGRDGITDMSTASSIGFIAWEEIKDINIRRTLTQKFIGIDVYDIDKLMKRISPLKQASMKMNLSFKFSPVSISLNTADEKIDDVALKMQEILKEHHQK